MEGRSIKWSSSNNKIALTRVTNRGRRACGEEKNPFFFFTEDNFARKDRPDASKASNTTWRPSFATSKLRTRKSGTSRSVRQDVRSVDHNSPIQKEPFAARRTK